MAMPMEWFRKAIYVPGDRRGEPRNLKYPMVPKITYRLHARPSCGFTKAPDLPKVVLQKIVGIRTRS